MTDVAIFYDNTNITASVLFATASFESQLGAQPGQFEFAVRDPTRTLSFATGKRIRLELDGVPMYGGYVMQVVKKFAFPVDDTVTAGVAAVKTRQWILRGVDYNTLFDKRFLFDKADPDSTLPIIGTSNLDGDVVQYMCNNLLDLSSDDIDTTTQVMNVGDPTPSGRDYGFSGVATPWRKEMIRVSAKTGAIWYLGPGTSTEILLYYRDRETVTPDWGFSDTPNGTSTFGFRDVEVTEDSSNLVNDALVWGGNQYGATGSTGDLTFGRAEDNDSINDLFRSQRAEAKFGDDGYLTNADAQVRANVIVFGDPGGAGGDLTDIGRGLGNPQKALRLTWFGETVPTVLVPGSVVTVDLNTFGESYTLPVRNIRLSFDTPGNPEDDPLVRFSGFLGVQTDDPFYLWKYMAGVASSGGTGAGGAGNTGAGSLTPTGTGTTAAPFIGTLVNMVPLYSDGTPATDPGGLVSFYTRDPYQSGSLRVWVNGLRWRAGIEYTESDPAGRRFTFYSALLSTDQIWVSYLSAG